MNKPNESDTPETTAFYTSKDCGEIMKCIQHARRLERERDQLRAEVERLKQFFTDGRVNWDALNAMLERVNKIAEEQQTENVALRAQVAARDEKIAAQAERIRYLEGATNHATGTPLSKAHEALKVAGEALKNCLNNSPLNPFERADAIQSALRRIEELTKGEGP